MKKSIVNLLVIIAVFSMNATYGANPKIGCSATKIKQFINHKDWSFVENKGQIAEPETEREGETGSKYKFHPEIKYYGHQGGVYLYCKPAMLSFVFTKTEKAPEQISEATGTTKDGRRESPFTKGAGGFNRSPLSALLFPSPTQTLFY